METRPYKDRSAGLAVFGTIHILLGLLCILLTLAIIAATEIVTRRGTPAPPQASLAQNVVMYTLAAAYLLSVGIGSIRARRWARALIVVVSWIWLIAGLLCSVMLLVMMPHLVAIVPPQQARVAIGIITTIVVLFYVLVPAAFILFYQRDDVRATCEARDPRVRWTDRAPLPVLGVSVILAFSAVVLLANVGRSVLPLLGAVITGPAATLALVAFAGLMAYLSVQMYRLKQSAWWTLVLLQIGGGVVAGITLARLDFNDLYARMGLLTPQLRSMHLEQIPRNPMVWGTALVAWIVYFVFLIWIRRYFGSRVG